MNNVLVIFGKDLRETLRDRRSFIRMLLLPGLLIPLMGHFFLQFSDSSREKVDAQVLQYAIVGEANLPDLGRLYADVEGFRRADIADDAVIDAVRSREIAFALRIPDGASGQLAAGEGVVVELIHNQVTPSDNAIRDRAVEPLASFSKRQRDWRLVFMGVSGEQDRTTLLDPVSYQATNTASERERIGNNIGTLIAYPLLVICFMGCAFTAVEVAAGEKERGTLEILVMLPVPRIQIILGKYLTVFVIGMLYSTFSMISLFAWLAYEGTMASEEFRRVSAEIGLLDLFLVWLMLVPVTALFSAAALWTSIHAKTYREAGTLGSLANFVVVVAATLIFVPGVHLNWGWALVPISNVGLAIRELIKGTLYNPLLIGSIFLSTVVIGSILLLLATLRFEREDVIFKE